MTARLIILCMALGLASPLWAEEDVSKPGKNVGERLRRIEGKLDALSGVILRLMSERQKALEKERDDHASKARELAAELAREKTKRTVWIQEAAQAKTERRVLEQEVAALKKALAEFKAKYDKLAAKEEASSAAPTSLPVLPSAENLFGEVVQIHRPTDSPEIAVISIGHDRGVQAGHRFVVHRRGRYIAKFSVDHVYAERASGKVSEAAQGEQVRVGDRVAVDETSLTPAAKNPDPPGLVGSVTQVDLLTRIVTISRGWSDNLRKGEVFQIFGRSGKGKKLKGTVQVLLLKENSATCMILTDVTAHPMRSGDRVFRAEEKETGKGSSPSQAPLIVGWISGVSGRENLVVINVGEEEGVRVGFEFHVFQGKAYAGTMVIQKVYANQSAGRLTRRAASRKIRVGDKVSTRR